MVIISTRADEVIIQAVSPEFSGSLVRRRIGAARGQRKRAKAGKRCQALLSSNFQFSCFSPLLDVL